MAPFDRGPDGAVVRRGAASAPTELAELGLEPREDLRGRHRANPRGGKLDREGQAIHALAQLHDRGVDFRARHEVGPALSRSLDEQAERFLGLQRVQAPHRFAVDAERLAARREDPHAGARCQHGVGKAGAGLDHVLAVVEDEEQVATHEEVPEHVGRRCAPRAAKAQHPSRFVGDVGLLRPRGEIDEPHAVGSAADLPTSKLESQPGLAHPTRAGEGHQPSPAQRLTHRLELPSPPEQRRQRRWQVVLRGRAPLRRSSRGGGHQALASHPHPCCRTYLSESGPRRCPVRGPKG